VTGTAAAGTGSQATFRAEDGAGVIATAGAIFAQLKDVTTTAVYSVMGFYNNIKGAVSAKLFVGSVYASHLRTNISTAGQTTAWSVSIPANYFGTAQGGHIRFRAFVRVDSNANARTLTARLIVGGTTVTYSVALAANGIFTHIFDGFISQGGSNVQDCVLSAKRWNASDLVTTVQDIQYAAAAETDTAAIAASLTFQLSGTVDSGWFNAVEVEAIDTGNTW